MTESPTVATDSHGETSAHGVLLPERGYSQSGIAPCDRPAVHVHKGRLRQRGLDTKHLAIDIITLERC